MPYQPKTERQGGYSHTKLAPNVFDVHYSGSGRYDGERVADFLLLRAAELCLEAGHRFVELERPDGQTQVASVGLGQGLFEMPTIPSFARAVCFTGPGADQAVRFDAAFVARSVRRKYGMP